MDAVPLLPSGLGNLPTETYTVCPGSAFSISEVVSYFTERKVLEVVDPEETIDPELSFESTCAENDSRGIPPEFLITNHR